MGKTITFAKVPTLLIVSTISEIMAVGSIPTRRIMWNSTHILCGGMTVIGGILPNGGLQILARATAENFIRGDKTTP